MKFDERTTRAFCDLELPRAESKIELLFRSYNVHRGFVAELAGIAALVKIMRNEDDQSTLNIVLQERGAIQVEE